MSENLKSGLPACLADGCLASFSVAGNTVTPKRACLAPSKVEQLVTIKDQSSAALTVWKQDRDLF